MVNWIWLVVVAAVGYTVGGIATILNIRKKYPDLLAELARRCRNENS